MNKTEKQQKKEWREVGKTLIYVTVGKNSYIGKLVETTDEGTLLMTDVISSGVQQVMAQTGPSPQDVQPMNIPMPGLSPWLVDEPIAAPTIKPDMWYMFADQSDRTQEAIGEVYTTFLEHLKERRESETRQVKIHQPGELAVLQAASRDPSSLLSQFGPASK